MTGLSWKQWLQTWISTEEAKAWAWLRAYERACREDYQRRRRSAEPSPSEWRDG